MPTSEVQQAAMRLARASRSYSHDPEERAEARRQLERAKLERAIQAALATAPPLTVADREEFATLLAPWAL